MNDIETELEYLESVNKMINLSRARQNVRLAVKMGIAEVDAKKMFYKCIAEEK